MPLTLIQFLISTAILITMPIIIIILNKKNHDADIILISIIIILVIGNIIEKIIM